jgi:aromatic-L-amino-acid decarboxylase
MNRLEISSDQFRKLADRVTGLAAGYLDELDSRPVAPGTSGDQALHILHAPLPEQGLGESAFDLLPEIMRLSRAQNARFFGYVLGSGEPVAAIGDLLASVINQNVTAWRSGPAAVTIEQTVVSWLSPAADLRPI